jgi:tRNA(Ile)-lysidine synthase
MARAGPGPFVRPLLGIERAALRGWLGRHRLTHRTDPSNRSLGPDRNRVRHRIVPALAASINPRAARLIVQAVERFREDAEWLDRVAEALLERIGERAQDGTFWLDAPALAAEAPVLARRVAHLALRRAGVDPRRVGARHVLGLFCLACARRPAELHLPGRKVAFRRGDRIGIGASGTERR